MNTAGGFESSDRTGNSLDQGDRIKAALTLSKDVMLIKVKDKVAITCDEFSDDLVANALMTALEKLGAEPTVVKYRSESFKEGKLPDSVSEFIYSSDVWLELSQKYALYSETRFKSSRMGVRYSCLTGMDSDLLVKAFYNVDYDELLRFGDALVSALRRSEELEVVSGNGTYLRAQGKVKFSAVAGKPNGSRGSTTMFAGTVNWISPENGISGEIVVDGSIWPPIGILREPVKFKIEEGVIREISGGAESLVLNRWIQDLQDENMYRVAHLTVGFHPHVKKLRGKILEDERLFGSFQIGFGTQGPAFGKKWVAKAHSDAIITHPTVKLDGRPILQNGNFISGNFSESSFGFLGE